MADQLYLTYRLHGFSSMNMLRQWERLLRVFPFSRLSETPNTLRVNAVSFREPPLFERDYPNPLDLDLVMQAAREFAGSDCAVQLEGKWDLWRYTGDWRLAPAPVTLTCFAPEFEDANGEHLQAGFGPDALFLPDLELPNAAFMSQSNIKSLLHFVHEADQAFTAETRRLWTESGENFADRVKAVLEEI